MLDNLLEFIDDLERTPEFDLDGHIDLVELKIKCYANKFAMVLFYFRLIRVCLNSIKNYV